MWFGIITGKDLEEIGRILGDCYEEVQRWIKLVGLELADHNTTQQQQVDFQNLRGKFLLRLVKIACLNSCKYSSHRYLLIFLKKIHRIHLFQSFLTKIFLCQSKCILWPFAVEMIFISFDSLFVFNNVFACCGKSVYP